MDKLHCWALAMRGRGVKYWNKNDKRTYTNMYTYIYACIYAAAAYWQAHNGCKQLLSASSAATNAKQQKENKIYETKKKYKKRKMWVKGFSHEIVWKRCEAASGKAVHVSENALQCKKNTINKCVPEQEVCGRKVSNKNCNMLRERQLGSVVNSRGCAPDIMQQFTQRCWRIFYRLLNYFIYYTRSHTHYFKRFMRLNVGSRFFSMQNIIHCNFPSLFIYFSVFT